MEKPKSHIGRILPVLKALGKYTEIFFPGFKTIPGLRWSGSLESCNLYTKRWGLSRLRKARSFLWTIKSPSESTRDVGYSRDTGQHQSPRCPLNQATVSR